MQNSVTSQAITTVSDYKLAHISHMQGLDALESWCKYTHLKTRVFPDHNIYDSGYSQLDAGTCKTSCLQRRYSANVE